MSKISTVILAAGNSTRYKGKSHKLLEQLGGLPVISHVYRSAKKISGKELNLLESSIFAERVGLVDEKIVKASEFSSNIRPYFSLLLIRQSWPLKYLV